jgi:hypothetical protein
MSVISVTNQNYQNGVLSNQLRDSGREWGSETQSDMRQRSIETYSKAESKEKHGVWDPMSKLTITSSYVQHIYHGQPYSRVDFIPQSGTSDLASVHHGLKLSSHKATTRDTYYETGDPARLPAQLAGRYGDK